MCEGSFACPVSPYSESPKHLCSPVQPGECSLVHGPGCLSQGLAGWVAYVPGDQHGGAPWDDGGAISSQGTTSSFCSCNHVGWFVRAISISRLMTLWLVNMSGRILLLTVLVWFPDSSLTVCHFSVSCLKVKGVTNPTKRNIPSHRTAVWTCESCEVACIKPAWAMSFCANWQQPCDSKMEMLSAMYTQYLFDLTLAFCSEFLSPYSK